MFWCSKINYGENYHNSNNTLPPRNQQPPTSSVFIGAGKGADTRYGGNEDFRRRVEAIDAEKIPSRFRAFVRRFQMLARTSRRDGKKFSLTSKQLQQLAAIEEGAWS